MRPFRLAQIAAEAEGLRLRHQIRRAVIRVLLGSVAMTLLLGAVAFAHVAAWYWLRESLARYHVALIFAGVDLLLALILFGVAVSSTPGAIEREALAVRRRALDSAVQSVTVSALLIRLVELFAAVWRRR